MSYVTGSHSMRFGGALTAGNRRNIIVYTGDVAADHVQHRRAGVGDAAPAARPA